MSDSEGSLLPEKRISVSSCMGRDTKSQPLSPPEITDASTGRRAGGAHGSRLSCYRSRAAAIQDQLRFRADHKAVQKTTHRPFQPFNDICAPTASRQHDSCR